MSECKDINTKYLRAYEAGVEIRIERSSASFIRKLPFRKNGGYDRTWNIARLLRDQKHLELFGVPISQRFYHVSKKSGSNDLPAGISFGYSRGKLLYIVVSWCPTLGHVKRKRFNINKLGFNEALTEAKLFRTEILRNIE